MPRPLLIDTNLLLVLVLGEISPEHISRWSRTSQYSIDDLALLREIIDRFDEVVVTPHVLTETSNLLGQLEEPLRGRCRAALGMAIPAWQERWDDAKSLVGAPVYLRLGLTDAAIYRTAEAAVTILTDDFDLYRATTEAGRQTINFTHSRAEHGLL